jgi:hypothetical protein
LLDRVAQVPCRRPAGAGGGDGRSPPLAEASFVNGTIVPVDGGRAVLGHDPEL